MSTRLITALIAASAAVVILASVVAWIRSDAKEDALGEVRENNEQIGDTAEQGALDYSACRARGLPWDWDRNRCGR